VHTSQDIANEHLLEIYLFDDIKTIKSKIGTKRAVYRLK